MIAISGNRSILVKLLAGQISLADNGTPIQGLTQVPPAEVSAIFYRGDSNQLIPDMLIVDTPNLREFFAWCNTYLPQWSPLSAGMHVIDRRRVTSRPLLTLPDFPRRLLRGLLSAALGELLFEWQTSDATKSPNVLSLRSTFGYAATYALISNQACLSDLISKWMRAQHLLQLPPRRVNTSILKTVWAPLFTLVKPTLDISTSGSLFSDMASAIDQRSTNKSLKSRSLFDLPKRREQIVIELENAIHESKLADSINCFEAAIIASRMSSSPLSHFEVLSEMTNSEPLTLLWYSFLSGMFATDPAAPIYEKILYRIESDLRGQPCPRPDIALDELEVLIGSNGQVPDGIGIGARFINIEIDFGVNASFRLKSDTPPVQSPHSFDDLQLFEGHIRQIMELFRKNMKQKSNSEKQSTKKLRSRRKDL